MAPTQFGGVRDDSARAATKPLLVQLALLLGLIMPLVSAALYPTYTHTMASTTVEWTRLIELPYVVCELGIIAFALQRGLRVESYWHALPRDAKAAMALLTVGLFVSSTLVSKQPLRSIEITLITLVHLQFALAIYHLALNERLAGLRSFLPILGAGVLLLGLLTAWKFMQAPPPSAIPGGKIEWSNALPGFISVRHFGAWSGAVAAGLMIALLFPEEGERKRYYQSLYVVAACLTAWSGTRAAVAAMAAVGFVFMLTLRRFPRQHNLLAVSLLSIAALGLAYCLPAPTSEFWLFNAGDLASAEALTGGRLALWDATYHKWLQAPVFGWGSGSTFWEVYVGWSHTQPHNVVLQFLISWGLVGAAGGLWLIGRALAAVHRPGVVDPALRPLTAITYALLFQSLLEGMLHYPRFIMMITVGLAIVMAQRNLTEKSPPRG